MFEFQNYALTVLVYFNHFFTSLYSSFKKFPNKIASNVPNDMSRNPLSYSFAPFLIV